MTGTEIALLSILAILVLVYSGLHVPVAFCLVSLNCRGQCRIRRSHGRVDCFGSCLHQGGCA